MFIGKYVKIGENVFVAGSIILGKTVINDKSKIFPQVIVGFPTRYKIMKLSSISGKEYDLLDEISDGVHIGRECVIRSFSTIYEGVHIGNNVKIGHNVLVREGTFISDHVVVGSGTIIDGYVFIGSNVSIESGAYIPPKTVIEDNVFIGPRVVITNDKYPASKRLVGVNIKKNVVIGANATLIAGITVGENSVIAAGAVVTKNVPPNTVVAGVPAKPIMRREDYEEKKRKYEKLM